MYTKPLLTSLPRLVEKRLQRLGWPHVHYLIVADVPPAVILARVQPERKGNLENILKWLLSWLLMLEQHLSDITARNSPFCNFSTGFSHGPCLVHFVLRAFLRSAGSCPVLWSRQWLRVTFKHDPAAVLCTCPCNQPQHQQWLKVYRFSGSSLGTNIHPPQFFRFLNIEIFIIFSSDLAP